jgi:hypothetical protein
LRNERKIARHWAERGQRSIELSQRRNQAKAIRAKDPHPRRLGYALQGFPDWTLRSNIGREYDSGACPVRRGFPCPFGHLGRGRSNHGQVRAEFEVIERRHAWSVIDDLVPRIDETDVPGKTGAKYITRKEQAGRSFSRARPEDCQGPRLEEALYRLVAQGQGVQLSKACINNARIPTGFPSAPASIAGDEGKLQAYDLVAFTSMPAMSNRPPSGPDWLHEIKFDGYRVIARKDGGQVRLWARTTSDYSKAFTRIRDAVAALPVHSAVLDGEAVVMRPDNSFDFETLRSRQGQAEAILVAYDIMDADGQDLRPEPLEERRKRLAKLLSRSNKALRDGIQLSEAITGDGAAIFRHAC